jgi:hypothetical protein
MISLSSSRGILNCAILCEIGVGRQIALGKMGFDTGTERRGSISGSVSLEYTDLVRGPLALVREGYMTERAQTSRAGLGLSRRAQVRRGGR